MPKLNPHISVDCVIFGYDFTTLNVLLIERGTNALTGEPRQAIPGDLIYDNENLDAASDRVLYALTGLSKIYTEQVGAYGSPERTQTPEDTVWLSQIRKNPKARVVTIVYYALINMQGLSPKASSFADGVYWCPMAEVPDLAFDHNELIDHAYTHLKNTLKSRPVGYNLMPDKFTLNQLQTLYEIILGRKIDKRNFRRKIKKLGILRALDEKEEGVAHKPSRYYEFVTNEYDKLLEKELEVLSI